MVSLASSGLFQDESSLFPDSPPNEPNEHNQPNEGVAAEPKPVATAPADLGFTSTATTPLFPDDFDSGSAFFTGETVVPAVSDPLSAPSAENTMSGFTDVDNTWDEGHDYMAVDSVRPSSLSKSSVKSQTSEESQPAPEPEPQPEHSLEPEQAPEPAEEDNRPKLWDTDDDDIPGEPEEPQTKEEPRPSTEAPSTVSTASTASTAATSIPRTSAEHSKPQRRQGPTRPSAGQSLYSPQTYYQQEAAPQNGSMPYYHAPGQAYPQPGGNFAPPPPQKTVADYVLRTKVTGMERSGKKPPLIKFDAYTNLPRFRTTQFRDIRRTYGEFLKLFKHLSTANPECFVPTVPADTTAAGPGTDEDDYRIKVNFQKWLDRVTSNPVLMRDEEMMFFIESDFGYSPLTKKNAPATGLRRKALKQLQPPPDDCQELVEFRPLVKRFYLASADVRDKLEKVSKVRKNLGMAEIELGHRFTNMTALEFQSGMINMWKKLGKTVMSVGDIEGLKTVAEMTTLGDGLEWLSNDAYVVKETLTNRQMLIRELLSAQSTSRSRHATAARLRSSATINPLRVDEALNSLEDAKQIEAALTSKVTRVTNNLTKERREWYANTDDELQGYIADYVRRMIDAERRTLAVWESIRVDIRTADGSGGLSRLGRSELPPVVRRTGASSSQGPKGDSWSGDRKTAHVQDLFPGSDEDMEDETGISELDAKNAAALLAASTF